MSYTLSDYLRDNCEVHIRIWNGTAYEEFWVPQGLLTGDSHPVAFDGAAPVGVHSHFWALNMLRRLTPYNENLPEDAEGD